MAWSSSTNSFSQAVEERRKDGAALIDLTVSNPTQVLAAYPHTAIGRAYAGIGEFTYRPDPFGQVSARLAIADLYGRQGMDISPSQVVLTASTSEAYALLFKLFCDPGDEVLAPVPSYPLFEYLAALESVRVVPYRLLYDGSWFIDFTDLGEKILSRTRAIIVVNPNNPTGSFLKKSETMQLLELARRLTIPVISDEVFLDYQFGGVIDRAGSLAGSDSSALTFCLSGLSKSAGMPQMKLGWIVISGPLQEREAVRSRLELILDTYLSVGTPVQNAVPELLAIGAAIREQITARTNTNLDALSTVLRNTPAHVLHTEGGWSAIIQLPKTLPENRWVTRLLDEQGVIVQPGYFFDMQGEPYVVVSLLSPLEEFVEGVHRLQTLVAAH